FWNIQNKILASQVILEKTTGMQDMTWYMILPYLTEKGREEYNQINDYLKKEQNRGSIKR
ncbi:MAG: hypothetical protein AAFU64_01345, partial [Bacteroidota bacterium]